MVRTTKKLLNLTNLKLAQESLITAKLHSSVDNIDKTCEKTPKIENKLATIVHDIHNIKERLNKKQSILKELTVNLDTVLGGKTQRNITKIHYDPIKKNTANLTQVLSSFRNSIEGIGFSSIENNLNYSHVIFVTFYIKGIIGKSSYKCND